MRLRQPDGCSAITDEPNHPRVVPDDETVTLTKDRENKSDTPSDSDEKPELGRSTEIRDGQGNNGTSTPAKPSATLKTVMPISKPADPSVLVKPVQSMPTPTVLVKPTGTTKPVKPTEPVKPIKPDSSYDDSGSSGVGSGGSTSYPAVVMEIITPEYSHAGTAFEVKMSQRNVKSLEWTISQNGTERR